MIIANLTISLSKVILSWSLGLSCLAEKAVLLQKSPDLRIDLIFDYRRFLLIQIELSRADKPWL